MSDDVEEVRGEGGRSSAGESVARERWSDGVSCNGKSRGLAISFPGSSDEVTSEGKGVSLNPTQPFGFLRIKGPSRLRLINRLKNKISHYPGFTPPVS